MAAAISLAVAFGLSACENVASFTQPSLVRVIDASYIAPAVNVVVEGIMLAATSAREPSPPMPPWLASASALVKITAATEARRWSVPM